MAKKKVKQSTETKAKPKSSIQEQIKELEKEVATTKYNKKTQHHIGLVKAKIARLREKQEARKKSGKKGEGYSVRKTGDATVLLLGFPSVGKSTLLNALTNAQSQIAAYAFTTLTVVPGLLKYKHAKIQILDVPGIVTGAAAGTGRGKEVLAVLRNADLALIIVDVNYPEHQKAILREVYNTNIRLDKRKPDVRITKTIRGGIRVGSTVKLTHLTKELIQGVMREFKIANADVLIRTDITVDELIDVIEANKVYMPMITLVNKVDMATKAQIEKIKKMIKPDLMMSAEKRTNVKELKDMIFEKLNFIRIYLKEVGKKPDLAEPLIMFKGCTIRAVCNKLHKDFVTKFRFARVWGKSAKFDGQSFRKLDKGLQDEDILELHIS